MDIDLTKTEVHRKALENVAEEMAITLVRTSGSPVVTDGKDFSTCIMDEQNEQIAFSGYISFHISTSFLAVEAVLEHYDEDEIGPGDAFLCNDPHTSGAIHQGDLGIVMPYYYEDERIGWGYVNEHVLDIGGSGVSGFAPEATDCYSEGPRFPAVKIRESGELIPEWKRFIGTNVRVPVPVLNDIRSMIAANNVGKQRLRDRIKTVGLEQHRAFNRANKELTEDAIRQRVQQLPDGVYTSEDWIEYDGHGDPELYNVNCELTVSGDELTFQFRGDPQAEACINGTKPVMYGQTMTSLLCQFIQDIPVNAGVWEPVGFDLGPQGTVVNAQPPAPVTQGHSSAGMRVNKMVTDVVSQAVSLSENPDLQDRVAGQANAGSTVITASGMDDRTGEPFVIFPVSLAAGVGGGAQTPHDGLDTYGSQPTLGLGMPDVEVEESTTPSMILFRRIRPNSGGPGFRRGGQGMETGMVLLHAETMSGTAYLENYDLPPRGFGGGYPGSTCEWHILRDSNVMDLLDQGEFPDRERLEGEFERMPAKSGTMRMSRGDAFVVANGGGGGLGDPLDRALEEVRADLDDGYITAQNARRVYGLVPGKDGLVDQQASRERRQEMRAERLGSGEGVPEPNLGRPYRPLGRDEGSWVCLRCEQGLGSLSKNWRTACVSEETPVRERFEEWDMYVRNREDYTVVLRQHACPSCGGELGVDVTLQGRDMVPAPRFTDSS